MSSYLVVVRIDAGSFSDCRYFYPVSQSEEILMHFGLPLESFSWDYFEEN